MLSEHLQLFWLFVLAVPIASVAWTVTHEEIFREPREYCVRKSESCRNIVQRKFFYLFTCEYCFSHYIAAGAVWFTGYRLLMPEWRGAILAWFALVWVANVYMSLFGRLRLDIKRERVEIKAEEQLVDEEKPAAKQQPAPKTVRRWPDR
jgi:hypothetical protein